MIGLLLILFGCIVAFGVWRRFSAIQWIWLLFGAAIALMIIWLLLLVLVIGPEMRRMAAPGG